MSSLASVPPVAAAAPNAHTDNSQLDLVVVLAVSKMDWHLAIKWLQLTAHFAQTTDNSDEYDLAVLFSSALSAREIEVLSRATMGVYLKPGRNLVFRACELNEIGYFGSPNQMFKGALDLCEQEFPGQAMLWCEADTVPMRKDWVEAIQTEYRACGRPFMGDVHLCEVNHMTGNAVYHPEWRSFAPSLALLPGPDLTIGWDSQCAFETFPQCHVAKTIQQIWRPEKIDKEFLEKKIRPETALFHQDKTGHLIDLICDREGVLRFGNYEPLARSTYDQPTFAAPSIGWGSDMPRMEIFVVTFWRDVEYFKYLVRSIQRFATGFSGVTIAIPREEDDGRYKWLPAGFKLHVYDEPKGKGFLQHMVIKCSADLICPGADYFLHLDPDCMFLEDANPGDFLVKLKPKLVVEKYSVCGAKNPNRLRWQSVVADSLGWSADYETMVRHPAVHHHSIYQKMRQLVEKHTKVVFDRWVLSGQNKFPQTFCEFNTLGAVALEFMAPDYHIVIYDRNLDALETQTDPGGQWQYLYRRGRDKVVEFYSLHPVQQYWPDMDAILARKPKDFYVK